MECSRTCMFGDKQLGWSGSYSFCLLGISRVAHICSEERVLLSVGEQVAVAGPAGLGTCSNELSASYPCSVGQVFYFELIPCFPDVSGTLIRAQANGPGGGPAGQVPYIWGGHPNIPKALRSLIS